VHIRLLYNFQYGYILNFSLSDDVFADFFATPPRICQSFKKISQISVAKLILSADLPAHDHWHRTPLDLYS
jgi:hypothetical protein